jgi:hypothetical protein
MCSIPVIVILAYVVEGSETYQLEGKPEVVVKAGDLFTKSR